VSRYFLLVEHYNLGVPKKAYHGTLGFIGNIILHQVRVTNSAPKEKLDKIGQPSLVLGLELLIFRSWQAKRATY
jgi:hypothetical protein